MGKGFHRLDLPVDWSVVYFSLMKVGKMSQTIEQEDVCQRV
jgi:hypothetical protein